MRAARGSLVSASSVTASAPSCGGYRPASIADGRAEGSHAAEFELICFDCGDNPGLDYFQVSPRLQRIRGPRTMETAWTA